MYGNNHSSHGFRHEPGLAFDPFLERSYCVLRLVSSCADSNQRTRALTSLQSLYNFESYNRQNECRSNFATSHFNGKSILREMAIKLSKYIRIADLKSCRVCNANVLSSMVKSSHFTCVVFVISFNIIILTDVP